VFSRRYAGTTAREAIINYASLLAKASAPAAIWLRLSTLLIFAVASSPGLAQQATPAGVWKTFNERTGQADGLVKILESNGEFIGQVTAVFSPPADNPNPVCDACAGELKNKPVVGMTIIRGIRRSGEDYAGGTILDPDSGTVYQCKLRVTDNGRKLEVRGYAGIPLFGRTQIWERTE
jgi:uncharacterized protein (DUF2147 family)